jgi:hypothetical protein
MVTVNAVRADKGSSQAPARPARPRSLAVSRLAARAGQSREGTKARKLRSGTSA